MVEPSTSVTISLMQFAINVSHPLLMSTSLTWTSCALPAIQEGPCAILYQCQSFDVPYLTHFPLLVGILCLAEIRSQWSKCSPATFSLETRHGWSHESTRAFSNDLSIPSQHGQPSHASFHSSIHRWHRLSSPFSIPIHARIHPPQPCSL